jgi:hypothetical protein
MSTKGPLARSGGLFVWINDLHLLSDEEIIGWLERRERRRTAMSARTFLSAASMSVLCRQLKRTHALQQ